MTRKLGFMIALAFGLAACGDPQGAQDKALGVLTGEAQTLETGWTQRFTALRKAGKGPALKVTITSKDISGGFLRETKQGNIETWLGSDGVGLNFDRGVLHGTRGLSTGMLASDVSASASAILSGKSAQVRRIHTFLDGNDQAVPQVFDCAITNQGTEVIKLDNGKHKTRRMSETCRNGDHVFTNTYWVGGGRILQSLQWSGEPIGQLSITTVYNF